MSDTAKHLIEEVIPEVPTRQWVLSMPYGYRFLLARDPDFLRKALAIFHRTLSRHYEYKARIHNLKNSKSGAITVVQRFGYIDGVFFENSFGDEVFFEIVPSHAEVIQLNGTLKKRLMRLLEKFEQVENDYNDQSDFQAQSVQNRDENFQLPLKIGKVWDPPFREFVGMRCSYDDGQNPGPSTGRTGETLSVHSSRPHCKREDNLRSKWKSKAAAKNTLLRRNNSSNGLLLLYHHRDKTLFDILEFLGPVTKSGLK